MHRAVYAALLTLFALALAPRTHAQTSGSTPTNMNNSLPETRSSRHSELDGPLAGMQEKLEKGRLSERQKRLVADTERLLALANELKADMDKTTKDQLSIDVIKKAEEIEKLARSVKERMKG